MALDYIGVVTSSEGIVRSRVSLWPRCPVLNCYWADCEIISISIPPSGFLVALQRKTSDVRVSASITYSLGMNETFRRQEYCKSCMLEKDERLY